MISRGNKILFILAAVAWIVALALVLQPDPPVINPEERQPQNRITLPSQWMTTVEYNHIMVRAVS